MKKRRRRSKARYG